MAKHKSLKKGKSKDQQSTKAGNEIHFFFNGLGANKPAPEYVQEFASKINSENSSKTRVYCLQKEASHETSDYPLVHNISTGDQKRLAEISQKQAYAVFMANSPLIRQFNPNEFSRLSLSEDENSKTYYEFSFKGK